MTLKHWLLGGLVAVLILGGLYGWTWLDPQRGLERRHAAFLGALEDRDWDTVRGMMAADYKDGFGFGRTEVTKFGEEVFARFEALSISDQNRLVELNGTSGRITARIRVGGRGDPVALSIVRGSQMMEKDRGIPRADIISSITSSIKSAAAKGGDTAGQDLRIEINPKDGKLSAFARLRVVDSVSDSKVEIHVEKAQELQPGAQLGEYVEKPLDLGHLGRILVQNTRQGIMQKIRQHEKDRIQDEFKSSVGNVVSGTLRRRERGDWIVEIGKAEAILPAKEQVPGEDYGPGDRIRALLQSIEQTPRGPEIILSRANPRFVRRLFELEVSEIADGTVTIEAFAREPGYRSKIAVSSRDTKVDPVGACVGARGARVKNIVRELNNEKVDVMQFHKDPRQMVMEALKPVVPRNVTIDEKGRRIVLEVNEPDLPLAIGRKGQNAKLTSKLLGWRLDISKFSVAGTTMEDQKKAAAHALHRIPGLSDAHCEHLVGMGIISVEALQDATIEDLQDAGFSPDDATQILNALRSFLGS